MFFKWEGYILNTSHIATVPPVKDASGHESIRTFDVGIQGPSGRYLVRKEFSTREEALRAYDKLVEVVIRHNYNNASDMEVQADKQQSAYLENILK